MSGQAPSNPTYYCAQKQSASAMYVLVFMEALSIYAFGAGLVRCGSGASVVLRIDCCFSIQFPPCCRVFAVPAPHCARDTSTVCKQAAVRTQYDTRTAAVLHQTHMMKEPLYTTCIYLG